MSSAAAVPAVTSADTAIVPAKKPFVSLENIVSSLWMFGAFGAGLPGGFSLAQGDLAARARFPA
ncbi:MAG: hypothetical protein OXC54_10625 [Rhodospirillaceae bacterium]|nr:hypothetical protein [Rhodospirillaceae bacterium]MCY4311740.1 hypothetical protein [Rhodospirillaceae bacterium]